MNKLDISKLKPVTIEDREVIESYTKKCPTPRSAYSIVSLMIWGTQFNAQWMEFENRLILYNDAWSCIIMPLGEHFSPAELGEISDSFCRAGKCGNITLADIDYVEHYRSFLTKFEIVEDQNTGDYIYLSERLASLSGKKLQKKKNLISQFRKAYGSYEVSDLQSSDSQECLKLSDEWFDNHPDRIEGYKYERRAMETAFSYFDQLKLGGKKLFYNGDLIAFTLFSELKKDMAVIHFEKYDNNYKGAAQLINWEAAKYLHPMYHYINREEDMGVEGLRKSKRSYQPVNHLRSYKLIRKTNETA